MKMNICMIVYYMGYWDTPLHCLDLRLLNSRPFAIWRLMNDEERLQRQRQQQKLFSKAANVTPSVTALDLNGTLPASLSGKSAQQLSIPSSVLRLSFPFPPFSLRPHSRDGELSMKANNYIALSLFFRLLILKLIISATHSKKFLLSFRSQWEGIIFCSFQQQLSIFYGICIELK